MYLHGNCLVVYEKVEILQQMNHLFLMEIENSRVAMAVTSSGITDVKSVYGGLEIAIGGGSTFTARHCFRHSETCWICNILLEYLE